MNVSTLGPALNIEPGQSDTRGYAVDDQGNIVTLSAFSVAQNGGGTRQYYELRKYSSDGELIFQQENDVSSIVTGRLGNQPTAMEVRADGTIVALFSTDTSFGNGAVIRIFSAIGEALTDFIEVPRAFDSSFGINTKYGLTVAPDGSFYVTSAGAIFNPTEFEIFPNWVRQQESDVELVRFNADGELSNGGPLIVNSFGGNPFTLADGQVPSPENAVLNNGNLVIAYYDDSNYTTSSANINFSLPGVTVAIVDGESVVEIPIHSARLINGFSFTDDTDVGSGGAPRIVAFDEGGFAVTYAVRSGSGLATVERYIQYLNNDGSQSTGPILIDGAAGNSSYDLVAIDGANLGSVAAYVKVSNTTQSMTITVIRQDGDGNITQESLDLGPARFEATGSSVRDVYVSDDGVINVTYTHPELGLVTQRVVVTEDDASADSGADDADTLTGTGLRDYLAGFDGNDTIRAGDNNDYAEGGAGADSLFGENGSDTLLGGSGNDLLNGGDGFDNLYGGRGRDVLLGGNQNDNLYGGDGNDQLLGERGVDFLYGGAGNDLLLGGNRNDRLFGEDGNDRVFGGNDNDIVDGGAGIDIVRGGNGDDQVFGGADGDAMFGGTGRDTLYGEDGDDFLSGRGGFDILVGGAGNDTLEGGAQADQFIFEDGFGNDTITDFASLNNAERIHLTNVTEITDFQDLIDNHMNQVGADVVIDDGLGNTITLLGVQLSDLDAVDFVF